MSTDKTPIANENATSVALTNTTNTAIKPIIGKGGRALGNKKQKVSKRYLLKNQELSGEAAKTAALVEAQLKRQEKEDKKAKTSTNENVLVNTTNRGVKKAQRLRSQIKGQKTDEIAKIVSDQAREQRNERLKAALERKAATDEELTEAKACIRKLKRENNDIRLEKDDLKKKNLEEHELLVKAMNTIERMTAIWNTTLEVADARIDELEDEVEDLKRRVAAKSSNDE